MWLIACGAVVFALPAPAQQSVPPPVELRFDIVRYTIEGNSVLPADEIERTVQPFVGKNRDFGDIQRALEALEDAYRRHGYAVVRVSLPEQSMAGGVVRFVVTEPRVRKVLIEDNHFFDDSNVRSSVPAVREGEVPNTGEIARNLQLTAEHPVKQTTVLLRAGDSPEELDVVIKAPDEKPWRAFFTLDNTGTGETGYWRSGFGYQHSNLFNRDHTLTAQYITSPTHANKVSIYGLGYRIPFYALNSALDLVAGYSDVNSGTVQGLFNVAGSGTVAGARWTYYLPKWGELEQKAWAGFDHRAFNNRVMFQGQSVVPDITIHPVSVGYSGLRRLAAAEFSFYGSVSANLPGGNDAEPADFRRARAPATAHYTILRYGAAYSHTFPNEWQARATLNAQYTSDALVAGEQFGLGGPDSVRGYLLREAVNDRGYQGQLELYTPDIASEISKSETLRARLLGFYDFGTVKRNHALPGEPREGTLASVGVGGRFGLGRSMSLRLDLAHLLRGTTNRYEGSYRLTAGLAVLF